MSFSRLKRLVALTTLMVFLCGLAVPAALAEGRKVVTQVKPVYPELAKTMRISGTVKIEAVVSPAGTVKSAKEIGGHPLLVKAALDAVKKFKFEPGSAETTEIVAFEFAKQ